MLLVGKPDQKTEHMASLVARQRDNREGYNVRTGKVIQEFGAAERSGVKMEKSQRGVPKHLLNQLKELLEERGALALNTIPDVYEEEFGYTLDWRNLGFTCMEICSPLKRRYVLFFASHQNHLAGWFSSKKRSARITQVSNEVFWCPSLYRYT